MPEPSGYVVYEGPSKLNGVPITAIVTNKSQNVKTGNMHSLWILAAGSSPIEAARHGLDDSVCGDCGLRHFVMKNTGKTGCYVTLLHGPQSIYRKWKSGGYPPLPPSVTFKRPLRLGAYGDPAALPVPLIRQMTSIATAGWTGYTHQWRKFPELQPYCMASVDSWFQQLEAGKEGWRTFRVIPKNEIKRPLKKLSADRPSLFTLQAEISCPASSEAGHRTTCLQCRLCDGMVGPMDQRKNICIEEH